MLRRTAAVTALTLLAIWVVTTQNLVVERYAAGTLAEPARASLAFSATSAALQMPSAGTTTRNSIIYASEQLAHQTATAAGVCINTAKSAPAALQPPA